MSGRYVSSNISIHSAARAETTIVRENKTDTQDFNPLRREGGDLAFMIFLLKYLDFNPLRREGGDILIRVSIHADSISIHSAARAETYVSTRDPLYCMGFQSTPPRGRRPEYPVIGKPPRLRFQSTPPRGRRLLWLRLKNLV